MKRRAFLVGVLASLLVTMASTSYASLGLNSSRSNINRVFYNPNVVPDAQALQLAKQLDKKQNVTEALVVEMLAKFPQVDINFIQVVEIIPPAENNEGITYILLLDNPEIPHAVLTDACPTCVFTRAVPNKPIRAGDQALYNNTTGVSNTAAGVQALYSNTIGNANTAAGDGAAFSNTIGSDNTAIGVDALASNTSGSNNTAIGRHSGENLTTGHNNIAIGNAGVAGDGNTIRLGDQAIQTRTFIAGIRGVTPGVAGALPVVIDSNGQLGTASASSGGTVTSVATGTGLTGGPITTTGTIALASSYQLPQACSNGDVPKSNGAGGWTCALDATGGGTVTAVTASAPLLSSGGTAPDISLSGSIPVANGGTGQTSLAANGIVYGQGTSAVATAVGIAGQVLTGTAGAPVWTGSPSLSGNLTLMESTSATTGNILKGTTPFIHNYGTQNTFVGEDAGNFSMSGLGQNTASGASALKSNTTGFSNTAAGFQALLSNTTGHANTADGWDTLALNTSGIANTASGYEVLVNNTTGTGNTGSGYQTLIHNTDGNYNTATGFQALQNNTGSNNTSLGIQAGYNLTSGDYNIDIGNLGVAGEGNTIRIGDAAHQARTFIAGIRGITTGSADAISVVVDSNGQLGTLSSSRRVKDDIGDMKDASGALMKLRPVTFHYKTDQNPSGRTLQYGLIAEEVAEVYPGLVAHSADGQIETVMYQFLPPMLLNEYQKQQRLIEAQAAEVTRLAAEVNKQTTRIADLEKQTAEIATLKQDRQAQMARIEALEKQASEMAMLKQQMARMVQLQDEAARLVSVAGR
jgi:hypothetical protein